MHTSNNMQERIAYMRTNFEEANDLMIGEVQSWIEWGDCNGLMTEAGEVRYRLSFDESGGRCVSFFPSANGIEAVHWEMCRVKGIYFQWLEERESTAEERAAVHARSGDVCATVTAQHSARRATWIKDLTEIERAFAQLQILTGGETTSKDLMSMLLQHMSELDLSLNTAKFTALFRREEVLDAITVVKFKMDRLAFAKKRARTGLLMRNWPQVAALRLIVQQEDSAVTTAPLSDEFDPREFMSVAVAPNTTEQVTRNRAAMRGASNPKSEQPFG